MDYSDNLNPIHKLAQYLADDQASVFVGAGFSRNAVPIDPENSPDFPLWENIAEEMYDRLYSKLRATHGDVDIGGNRREEGLTYLEIASLFEFLFGRQELDKLIQLVIPDNKYKPGEHHDRLLSLPWNDIYTTNFDTLLEKANVEDLPNSYDLVETTSELQQSRKKKIIKLHGSISAGGPYIITQKDYETYVDDHDHHIIANRIQSALTENAFCLIGFSGKDPNFDDRTWWARFHLRNNCLPIYIVCLDKVSIIRKQFFNSRGIYPIELYDEVVEAGKRNEKKPEQVAILSFLKQLDYSVNSLKISKSEGSSKFSSIIPIQQTRVFRSSGKLFPDHLPLNPDDLTNLYELWRKERESYPGWVVAPNNYRESLWEFTQRWIEPVFFNIKKTSPSLSISLLYELNWRLETTFCPLLPKWVQIIDDAIRRLEKTDNIDDVEPVENASLGSQAPEKNTPINQDYINSLHLSIARFARTNQDLLRYSQEIEYLELNLTTGTQLYQELCYEKALGSLFVFDEDRVRDNLKLENWPLDIDNYPMFAFRRASILAELGDLDDAERIVRDTITILQPKTDQTRPEQDISLYSQEAWGRLLLKALTQNRRESEPQEGEKKRNATLELLGLNPTAECSELESFLKPDPRRTSKKERRTIGFDPGHFTITGGTLTFSSNLEFSDLIPSYAMLKIFEAGGIPYHCGVFSLFKEGIVSSTEYIYQNSFYLSILSLFRTGDRDSILSRLNRMDVATMSKEEVDHLFSILEVSIPQALNRLKENEGKISLFHSLFAQRVISIFPEILSRLSFKLQPEQLSKAYSLGLALYQDPIIKKYYLFHEAVGKILPRTLYAMETDAVIERLPEILALPVPGYDSAVPFDPSRWTDPFEEGGWLDGISIGKRVDRKALDESIEYLLRIGDVDNAEARKRALLRMIWLYDNNYLNAEQASNFGKILWSRTDEGGFPTNTGLFTHEFLDLPEPEAGAAKHIIKESLLNTNFLRFIQYGIGEGGKKTRTVHGGGTDMLPWDLVNVSYTPRKRLIAERSNFVDWTDDELLNLLEKIERHWASLKLDLDLQKKDPMPFFWIQVESQLNGIVRALGDLFIPNFIQNGRIYRAQVCRKILQEIRDYGISIIPAYPSLIQLDSELSSEAEKVIHQGLLSDDDEEIKKSQRTLYYWSLVSSDKNQGIRSPPQHLWDLIFFELLLLRQPGLDGAIQLLCDCLDHHVVDFAEHQITTMIAALEKLMKEITLIENKNSEGQNFSRIRRDEVPYYRLLGATLSSTLYKYLEQKDEDLPGILLDYKKDGEVDILPEVRKIWRANVKQPNPNAMPV